MRMVLILLCGGLLACSDKGNDEAADGAFDDLTGTLDKAEAVEQQLEEQKQRMDKALEEVERQREEPQD